MSPPGASSQEEGDDCLAGAPISESTSPPP